MNRRIVKKLARFIELSNKFTVELDDIVDESDYKLEDNNVITSWASGVPSSIVMAEQPSLDDKKMKTTDIMKIISNRKILLVEEYEEYLELQKDLGNYFNNINKLTRN